MPALVYAAAWLPAACVWGFLLQSRGGAGRSVAWLLAALTVGGAAWAGSAAPFMPRMLLLVAATLVGTKAIVAAHVAERLPAGRWGLFCAWPGMNPRTLRRRGAPRPCVGLRRQGTLCLATGVACVLLGVRAGLPPAVALVLVFAGSSLTVHFGLFALATACLRRLGFAAEQLFRAPWRAASLAEFWGRRWNLGFAELTALVVFRPLRRRTGATAATVAAFLFSGLLHELAITVPARGGYGQPTLYFALQGVCVVTEPRLRRHGRRLARLWTWASLLAPLPLAFPEPFRDHVLAWFVHALGP